MLSTLAPTPADSASATIWPHQTRYRIAAQQTAQALFDALDDELHPLVLLLALPADPSSGLPPIIEPANAGLPLEPFIDAVERGRSKQLLGGPAYNSALLEDGVSLELLHRRFETRGVRAAVQETLEELDEHSTQQHFSSWPVRVGAYFVVTVLQMEHKPLRSYPSLRPDRYYTNGRPLASSLLEGALFRFNEECVKSLNEPEPGAGLLFRPRETDELLRAAGKSLLDTPAQALGADPGVAVLFTRLTPFPACVTKVARAWAACC
jgi:hypothetical protein